MQILPYLAALSIDTANGRILAYSQSYQGFVEFRGTTQDVLGGIIACSVGTINITGADYAGRIEATGNTAKTGNSIDSVKANGAGIFRGNIVTAGSFGTFQRTGDFQGALVATGDFGGFTITGGDLNAGGIIAVGGKLKTPDRHRR